MNQDPNARWRFGAARATRVVLGVLLSMPVSLSARADLVEPDTEYLVFHHRDVLGTAIATTDSNGNVVHHTSTTPYGRDLGRRADDGQGFSDNAYPSSRSGEGYTGHVNDRQLELTYMRARFYDPVLGRFLSDDPVGFTGENPTSFNRYAYANNSPYTYVDPDGHNAVTAIGGFFSETWEGISGRGDGQANYGNLGGAAVDGYNGEGAGFAASLADDVLSLAGGAVIGSVTKGAKLVKGATVGQKTVTGGADDFAQLSGQLRDAAKGKGNFGIGAGTREQSEAMGSAWAGDGVTLASDGRTLVSKDLLRQYRPPSNKPNSNHSSTGVQSNFEQRFESSGAWQSNGHLDILD